MKCTNINIHRQKIKKDNINRRSACIQSLYSLTHLLINEQLLNRSVIFGGCSLLNAIN